VNTSAMREWWKTITGFAVLGFAITGCFYVLYTYHNYAKSTGPLDLVLFAANAILCPPTYLFMWCIDCEYGTPAGLEVNLIVVGLLNAALYATVGTAVARRRKRKTSRAIND
jgi:hypothetical protein